MVGVSIAVTLAANVRRYRAAVMLRVLVALLALAGCCEALNIAAFNIEIFGVTKFSKPEVVATLSQVSPRLVSVY